MVSKEERITDIGYINLKSTLLRVNLMEPIKTSKVILELCNNSHCYFSFDENFFGYAWKLSFSV